MKKLFLFAAALATLCSCDKTPEEVTLPDAIKVSPATAQISRKGGAREVLISSNGEWTLEGSYDWATPSKTEGKDGDIVKFTVQANETAEDRVAEYTFKSGTASAKYTLTSLKKAVSGEQILEIAPETETIAAAGGKVEVIVTSSEDWTLEGSYNWITPSKTSGEDGDTVLFTVNANTTTEERVAEYTFKSGSLSAKFTLTNTGLDPEYLTVTSGESMDIKAVGGNFEITFDTTFNYRELENSIEYTDGEGWLSFVVAQPDENGENAVLVFKAAENTGLTDRAADITVTSPKGRDGVQTQKIHVDQFRKPVLYTDKSIYSVDLEGGDHTIELTTNVEYTATVEEAAKDWLSVKSSNDKQIVITVKGGADSAQGDITLTHESELGGKLEYKFSVLRKAPSIIEYVPDWTRQRAWPGDPSWTNASILGGTAGLTSWTCEALVNMNERKANSALSTVFGIEGHFLIRYGDAAVDHQNLQLVTPGSSYGSGSVNYFGTSATRVQLNTWTHVAITFDANTRALKVYYDGKEVASATRSNSYAARFAYTNHNLEQGSYITRCFWVSYAYEDVRYWPGQMCELRIWNRPLSADEINAENHFYEVENPEQNESLVAYWRCNENDNSGVMKDYSRGHNDLKYDTSKPFTWVPVSLGTPKK